jgi:hypothetical protein
MEEFLVNHQEELGIEDDGDARTWTGLLSDYLRMGRDWISGAYYRTREGSNDGEDEDIDAWYSLLLQLWMAR